MTAELSHAVFSVMHLVQVAVRIMDGRECTLTTPLEALGLGWTDDT